MSKSEIVVHGDHWNSNQAKSDLRQEDKTDGLYLNKAHEAFSSPQNSRPRRLRRRIRRSSVQNINKNQDSAQNSQSSSRSSGWESDRSDPNEQRSPVVNHDETEPLPLYEEKQALFDPDSRIGKLVRRLEVSVRTVQNPDAHQAITDFVQEHKELTAEFAELQQAAAAQHAELNAQAEQARREVEQLRRDNAALIKQLGLPLTPPGTQDIPPSSASGAVSADDEAASRDFSSTNNRAFQLSQRQYTDAHSPLARPSDLSSPEPNDLSDDCNFAQLDTTDGITAPKRPQRVVAFADNVEEIAAEEEEEDGESEEFIDLSEDGSDADENAEFGSRPPSYRTRDSSVARSDLAARAVESFIDSLSSPDADRDADFCEVCRAWRAAGFDFDPDMTDENGEYSETYLWEKENEVKRLAKELGRCIHVTQHEKWVKESRKRVSDEAWIKDLSDDPLNSELALALKARGYAHPMFDDPNIPKEEKEQYMIRVLLAVRQGFEDEYPDGLDKVPMSERTDLDAEDLIKDEEDEYRELSMR